MQKLQLLALASVMTLAGCISQAEVKTAFQNRRPATQAEVSAIVDAAREYVFDPYSIRDAEISTAVDLKDTTYICVKANAKNRLGAYTGKQTTLLYLRQTKVFMANQDWTIGQFCNNTPYRRFTEIRNLQNL